VSSSNCEPASEVVSSSLVAATFPVPTITCVGEGTLCAVVEGRNERSCAWRTPPPPPGKSRDCNLLPWPQGELRLPGAVSRSFPSRPGDKPTNPATHFFQVFEIHNKKLLVISSAASASSSTRLRRDYD
jgi:hypothetical protein